MAAEKRLLEIGVPATVEHASEASHGASNSGGQSNPSNAKHVADTVQVFITLMDSLKLNLLAVDQLHPQLSDLIQALHRVSPSSALQGSKDRIRDWLIALNKRKASDEISQEESRQLLFDLEGCVLSCGDSPFTHVLS